MTQVVEGDDRHLYDPTLQGKFHDLQIVAGRYLLDFKLGNTSDWMGLYEPEVVNVIGHFVEPGDLVVDAGASLGFFTVLLSKIVGDDGVVLAFEPEQRSFDLLLQNVRRNELNNTALFKQGLFSSNRDLDLWIEGPCGYSSVHWQHNGAVRERISAVTLDTILEDQPRFIKIDCEGAEEDILHGAEKTLRNGVDCVVLELNYHILQLMRKTDAGIRQFMHSLGYDMFIISAIDQKRQYLPPILIEPTLDFGLKRVDVAAPHMLNVMFSTKEKVKARWKT